MKKIYILLISIFMIFNFIYSAWADTKCNEQAGYIKLKNGKCYNSKTLLSYKDTTFYHKNYQCGKECDYNGRNCKEGICNVSDCAQGYTELKNGNCYNPKTLLSYRGSTFYHDGYYCGKDCNIKDGSKCNIGICSVTDCAAGYTELKESTCYNPKTLLSYKNTTFYHNGYECGKECDYNGRNCKIGICSVTDCAANYTELKNGNCYNPQTLLSYKSGNFYYKGHYCGRDCDIKDGSKCNIGICNASDCAAGYTELRELSLFESKYPIIIEKPVMLGTFSHAAHFRPSTSKLYCYNPTINLSYTFDSNKKFIFAKNDEICGMDCDLNGRNCKIGLCNAEDCPKGYKQFFHGACKSEKSDKILVPVGSDDAKKFRNEKRLTTANNAKYVADSVIMPLEILILLPISLFYP